MPRECCAWIPSLRNRVDASLRLESQVANRPRKRVNSTRQDVDSSGFGRCSSLRYLSCRVVHIARSDKWNRLPDESALYLTSAGRAHTVAIA